MKCEKRKSDIKDRFKPNRGRYIVLLIVFIVLTGTCFTIPQDNTWFAIIAGLGSGGFSSTLIAWLIAEVDSNRALAQAKENREILLNKLASAFNYGLQILIYNTEKYLNDESPRKWHEWINCAYQVVEEEPCYCHDYLASLQLLNNDIIEEIYALQSQSALMLEYGMMYSSDIEALSLILSMCDLIKCELRSNQSDEKIADNVTVQFNLMRAAIGYSPAMKYINDLSIDPTIYYLANRTIND